MDSETWQALDAFTLDGSHTTRGAQLGLVQREPEPSVC